GLGTDRINWNGGRLKQADPQVLTIPLETVVARLSREDAVDLLRSPVEESDAAFANPIGQLMPSQSLGSARPSSEPSVANCCSLQ
ncbi:hypothetical protein ACJH6H_25185, partial [Mycobacterium sp. SMC-21]|uniref:hypothetical protein n=1 Tax=Mycobacterium sp. SMC-21 TaxID=3381632 RepID=UPI003875BA6B